MRIDLEKITLRQKMTIAKGLCEYEYIMNNWQNNNLDFKEVYYEFYLKSRWSVMSKQNNKDKYFDELQDISPNDDLMGIIDCLKERMEGHSFEFSISSKLLHTRNSAMPIYDSKIRAYLMKEENVPFWWNVTHSSAPRRTSDREKIKHDWVELCNWYTKFLSSSEGKKWIEWFDSNFPSYTSISDVKKVDFIIFATN